MFLLKISTPDDNRWVHWSCLLLRMWRVHRDVMQYLILWLSQPGQIKVAYTPYGDFTVWVINNKTFLNVKLTKNSSTVHESINSFCKQNSQNVIYSDCNFVVSKKKRALRCSQQFKRIAGNNELATMEWNVDVQWLRLRTCVGTDHLCRATSCMHLNVTLLLHKPNLQRKRNVSVWM